MHPSGSFCSPKGVPFGQTGRGGLGVSVWTPICMTRRLAARMAEGSMLRKSFCEGVMPKFD